MLIPEEAADFGEELIALLVPLFLTAEHEDGFFQSGEADFLGADTSEFGEFAAEALEEGEFETISCALGGVGK